MNRRKVSNPPSPAISTVTLTPGRIRNIDQDMEALRASRQDNPFIKQVIASRESLADCIDEIEADDTNLMSQEFPADLDIDPLTLPGIHEHMIRSPPPTNWPKSPNHRIFQFPEDETLQVEVTNKDKTKYEIKSKHASWEPNDHSPLKGLPRPYQDRFSLLAPNVLRSGGEDSIRLMSTED
ncbi:PREDICTED: uncharacterized protein LOC108568115 isoform X2 [Nicrophorus vespilloides]|uniref:Uncharacterized protein LOC108568115 isoform X2 n=1 Tax=Nicrophorus vespilloides TaxID=110193 RepID=A0ABM1NCI0_NICVS|nr:PREDICTED: uncharacterized protein LOC108568115 isoform X2 [Nicrophorus vespilloides]